MIIFQGANDPRVVKAESDQFVDALLARGLDVEYMVYENEGHGFRYPENRLDYMHRVDLFLAKILGGRCEAWEIKHKLRIEALGETWLRVSSSEGALFTGLLMEGDSKTFGPESYFIVTVGKSENVMVYFDGRHIYGDEKEFPGMTFVLPEDYEVDLEPLTE